MRHSLILLLGLAIICGCHQPPTDTITAVSDDYLDAWVWFYPSRALTAGQTEAAVRFENLSQPAVDGWIEANERSLARLLALPEPSSLDDRIDRRLLEGQIRRELFRWAEAQIHRTDPQTYSNLINHSLTAVLVRSNLTAETKVEAAIRRLQGLQRLCDTARDNLVDGRPFATEAAIRDIRSTAAFIEGNLASAFEIAPESPDALVVTERATAAAAALDDFAAWLENDVNLSLDDAYGRELYARKLALAYGVEMTPERLESLALEEIDTVRGIMADLAARSWTEAGIEPAPADFDELVRPLLAEMEDHRVDNQQAFLREFLDLIERSRLFLEEKDLIDLPAQETLFTALSPSHFAGAAVGGVYSAGPFDPEAETLFYLPTVPDSAPEAIRDGFYRSFNSHFNTMIITHEIYPGHYLQLKAAASNPHRIRSLFAGNDFTEGWASFCEQMTLNAGWDDDAPLTRMAHLRKRLENAVRAYISVRVHCRGWARKELDSFAVETGLLPPQFAENLWHRGLLSPIQLPSYFIGFRVFDDVYADERDRRGESFSLKSVNDAVIESGGVPMDMLGEVVATTLGPR